MKNFKKVLALVLVLASLLGLATVAGATEYKDADKIDASYDEAIKVLDLIETMQGYPTGEFKPTATITREEAAKVIAIFDNKASDISTYYTSINPFADEKGRWGESYVGYGYRAGIIAGMNANTFAPLANVTGTQFLKMALVTLGYDQEAEGFVGSSWAVNVLALAKRIGLIDDLNNGWKPEAALTRQEAAQILLNTLKAETVEYGNEAKPIDSKVWVEKENGYVLNGKFYMTIAGAVKTGKYLYGEFDLSTKTSYDAFERPYVKWTKDKKSVSTMKPVKATFTTEFSMCDLLVALGIDKKDQDTTIVIDHVFCDGVEDEESAFLGNAVDGEKDAYDFDEGDEYTDSYLKDNGAKKDDYLIEGIDSGIWHHTNSDCHNATEAKVGAQGTLTQVFYMGKDAEGNKHYIVCSIETWLGKVEKVSSKTTARDDHLKGKNAVEITPYMIGTDEVSTKDEAYNNAAYCETHCDEKFTIVDADESGSGKDVVVYDDPTGLAKGDYVLFTYSFKQDDGEDMGVQSADVVTAKEGRLNGYKYADVSSNPSQTRIDGEYVKDAVHFHLGYDASKTDSSFGTKGFFYDAYGNVIGMKDAADVSKYGVLDKAWVEYSKGIASIHANIVGLDAKVTEDVIVATIKYGDKTADEVKVTTPDVMKGKYELTVKDLLAAVYEQNAMSEENYKSYWFVYDVLGKFEVNSKSEYTLSRVDDKYLADEEEITFVKGKPVLTSTGNGFEDGPIKVNSKTEFLVRTDDVGEGKYVSWTGYTGSNAKSVVAKGYDIVLDDDGKYATVVYLYDIVGFNDGKFVAYVPANANMWREKTSDDGVVYFILEVFVDGVKTEVKISDEDADYIKEHNVDDEGNVAGNFYEFRYREIGEVNTAALTGNTEFKLANPYTVVSYSDDGVLEVEDEAGDVTVMALASDCVIYSIRQKGDKVVKEDKGLEYAADYIDEGDTVYMNWNDKNDDGEDQIVALYVVETKGE